MKEATRHVLFYTICMGLFSFLKKSDSSAPASLRIEVDTPESVHASQGVVPVGVTIANGSEPSSISFVHAALYERYDRHTEDFQQRADTFHEVVAEAEHSEAFQLEPTESRTINLQLSASFSSRDDTDVVQENIITDQPVTKLLRTGPVVSNVLQLGNNKENLRYVLKITVEANGKLVSPPTNLVSVRWG